MARRYQTQSGAASNWPELPASPDRAETVTFQTINQQGDVTGQAPPKNLQSFYYRQESVLSKT